MATKKDAYRQEYRKKIADKIDSSPGKEACIWDVIEAVGAIIDGSDVIASARLYYDLMKSGGDNDIKVTPNPWFVVNKQDGETVYTQKYLKNRAYKGLGGGAIALAGSLASQATQVDVAGILQHGNAVGSTGAHIYQLQAIAGSYRQSQTISKWIGMLIRMKAIKAGVRGGQFAGAAIPVGAVGLATSLAATGAKLGVKLTLTKACLMTAADLHWRAFQEQRISGGLGLGTGGKIGPASRIMYELFARRGATRIFGKYDVDRLIHEPCGWMAVNDKLMLI